LIAVLADYMAKKAARKVILIAPKPFFLNGNKVIKVVLFIRCLLLHFQQ
jgi:hypothetical protein